MDIRVESTSPAPPVERAWVISMVIRSFKGRREVEVHLFRPDTDESEARGYDLGKLIGDPVSPDASTDPAASVKVMLEAFTQEERDAVVEYIESRYQDRVTLIESRPMDFPVPLGLTSLSSFPEGKNIGLIRFEKIPNCTLPFTVHGLYDLSRHKPLVDNGD